MATETLIKEIDDGKDLDDTISLVTFPQRGDGPDAFFPLFFPTFALDV